MPLELDNIFSVIQSQGGRPFIVGGYVRDMLMGIPSKDIDVEVYNLPFNRLVEVLEKFGKVSVVGQSFGVIKLTTKEQDYDLSLPRRDNKIGAGHKGFSVEVDSNLTPEEAAARRDFTINAIGIGPDGFLDPYNGRADIENKILRATSPQFCEDPLRVLRGFQFAARFDMRVESTTRIMCRELKGEYESLPKERVWAEWYKWGVKGNHPSRGLDFLYETGWQTLYPEINNLLGVNQDPEWHPEGCALTHTLLVCDAMAKICLRENIVGEDRCVLMFAALCHDFGKAFPKYGGTTEFIEGRWRSPGHDDAGVPLARNFLEGIGCFPRIIQRVLSLVKEHMVHCNEVTPRTVRRLANRLGPATIRELLFLIEADHSGRPPLPVGLPESARLIGELAQQHKVEEKKPEPIIMGRHLLDLGMSPGPEVGAILKRCMEAQLDGQIASLEDGLKFVFSLGIAP